MNKLARATHTRTFFYSRSIWIFSLLVWCFVLFYSITVSLSLMLAYFLNISAFFGNHNKSKLFSHFNRFFSCSSLWYIIVLVVFLWFPRFFRVFFEKKCLFHHFSVSPPFFAAWWREVRVCDGDEPERKERTASFGRMTTSSPANQNAPNSHSSRWPRQWRHWLFQLFQQRWTWSVTTPPRGRNHQIWLIIPKNWQKSPQMIAHYPHCPMYHWTLFVDAWPIRIWSVGWTDGLAAGLSRIRQKKNIMIIPNRTLPWRWPVTGCATFVNCTLNGVANHTVIMITSGHGFGAIAIIPIPSAVLPNLSSN